MATPPSALRSTPPAASPSIASATSLSPTPATASRANSTAILSSPPLRSAAKALRCHSPSSSIRTSISPPLPGPTSASRATPAAAHSALRQQAQYPTPARSSSDSLPHVPPFPPPPSNYPP